MDHIENYVIVQGDEIQYSLMLSTCPVEELKIKKVLLCHVETVTSPEVTLDVLQSAVPASADASKFGNKSKEIRRTFKAQDKHDQLLVKAKQSQESASKNARFKQIWRSRNSKEEATVDEPFHDICQFFDVVRVDSEGKSQEVLNHNNRDSELEDHKLMSQYLPLLKEFIPSAAVEIESDICDYISTHTPSDGFVYDIYAVEDEMNISEADVAQTLPLVQVDAEEDNYDGPDASDYESDDSNAENNPLNEYPDEESYEENTEDDTSCGDQSGSECRSSDDQSDGDENTIDQLSPSEDHGEQLNMIG
ncbi:hydrolase [Lithospermum erythrorhizon]|uniref:Hydrolase n=1 Tax=Lithospermum erythrorhizon TaxID=34254 RepID=A0AAV3PSV3_LITER